MHVRGTFLLLCFLFFVTPVQATPPVAASGAAAGYLYECGFLLVRCSGINMIRGLGLSRAQLLGLRNISSIIDSVSPPPVVQICRDSRWGPIQETFLRLERALRSGKPVPDSFRKQVIEVRQEESTLIREGLRFQPRAVPFSCGRCHGEVEESRWGKIPWIGPLANHPGILRERSLSHAMAPFGIVGYCLVAWYAGQVDAILREPQKRLVSSFSCCLLPPRNMSDPVRIGQADEGDWEAPLLDRIRDASVVTLPFLRFAVKRFLVKRQRLFHPGLSKREEEAVRTRIDTVIDGARALDDVDYALQKHSLAGGLRGDAANPLLTAAATRFKTAMFLLIPGSTAIYDEVLRNPSD